MTATVQLDPRGAPAYSQLVCDKCHGQTKVINSRGSRGSVRRRRECLACRHRFTTYEGRAVPSQAEVATAHEAVTRIIAILTNAGLLGGALGVQAALQGPNGVQTPLTYPLPRGIAQRGAGAVHAKASKS